MKQPISYKIYLDQLTQHLLNIECKIQNPNSEGQRVSLPAWVPGSYMIRDFGKLVVSLSAECGGAPIFTQKIDKNTWECAPCNGELVIKYQVYCFDLAPRGAYVDNLRVFFDGCRVFLVVEGEEEQTRSVEIIRPQHLHTVNWRCATSMAQEKIDAHGYGVYIANNHLDLIDHPFEISDFQRFDFSVANVPHSIIVVGNPPADLERLARDVSMVCMGHVNFFGELPPIERYIFILNVLGKGYGGIEHRSSSSLLCTRNDLPIIGNTAVSDEYRELLGLFSHEYFHAWNVKRIKPEVFNNPDLTKEVYTRQLWIFEGITSYYDNVNMVHDNIISVADYLKLLQKDISTVQQNPGVNAQNLEESSFDAWIKYYQPDENSVNTTVSYYLKGSLVALALDLLIIKNSRRKQSLADIMQVLWQQYGKTGLGLPENYFERITFEVTGEDYSKFFELALRTTEPLPLQELLLEVGIIYKNIPCSTLENIGVRFNTEQNRLSVRSVLYGSAFEKAGLAPNDILIAVNNFATNPSNIEATFARYQVQDILKIHVFRNDVLLELSLVIPEIVRYSCELEFANSPTEHQDLNLRKWLLN